MAKKTKAAKRPKSVIVEAAVTAGAGGGGNKAEASAYGIKMQAAMEKAITDTMASGVSNPDEIKKAIMAAREGVKAEAKAEAGAAAKDA